MLLLWNRSANFSQLLEDRILRNSKPVDINYTSSITILFLQLHLFHRHLYWKAKIIKIRLTTKWWVTFSLEEIYIYVRNLISMLLHQRQSFSPRCKLSVKNELSQNCFVIAKEIKLKYYTCLHFSLLQRHQNSGIFPVKKEVSMNVYDIRLHKRVTSVLMLNATNAERAVLKSTLLSSKVTSFFLSEINMFI